MWDTGADVVHPFSSDLSPGHFNPALVAHNTPKPNPLELAAVTLPVLDRAEYFGFQGSVVQRFRLFNFAS